MIQKDRILIVDDEKVLSDSLNTIFRLHNLESIVAYNGLSALEMLNNEHFDLVLCDINLPDITGYEILNFVRSNPRTFHIPFMFLSAYSDQKDIEHALKLGADDYITKPFSNKNLITLIKNKLEQNNNKKDVFGENENIQWLSVIKDNFDTEFISLLNTINDGMNDIANDNAYPAHLKPKALEITKAGYQLKRNTERLIFFTLLCNNRIVIPFNNENNIPLDILLREIIDYIAQGNNIDNNRFNLDISPVNKWKGLKDHLQIIFQELILNALNFSLPYEKIFIKLLRTETGFDFSISNVVTPNLHINLNDIIPFRKPYNIKNNGLGIGLFLCKEICRMYNYSFMVKKEDPYITFEIIS